MIMFNLVIRCLLVFGLSFFIICSEALADVEEKVAQLNQGWSEEEVQFYNYASEGTNLAPLEFVLNLPDPKVPGKKFIDKINSEYGFIAGQKSALNPYNLPVGFSIDERPIKFGDRPYLGVTCSACHTHQLTYNKTDSAGIESKWVLPVHGGPSLIDFPRFQQDLYDSFFALLKDDALMRTFAASILQRTPQQEDVDNLRAEIHEFTGPVENIRSVIEKVQIPTADFGPGNLNALTWGNYNNNVGLAGWLGKKGYIQPSDKQPLPIRFEGADNYPPVWFAPQDTWAQWFVEIHHPGPRNWIQSVSTSPVRPPKMIENLKEKVVLASIDFDNIDKIQESLERLRPPKWPEQVFGKLNQELIAKGKLLFENNCSQCHTQAYEVPNSLGIKFKVRQAYDVGTDPVAYKQFSENADIRVAGLIGISTKMLQLRETKLTEKYGSEIADNYMKYSSRGRPNKFEIAGKEDYSGLEKDSWEKSGATYWAPPMEGIFASSPYFHNGSVPTLWDVLSPPEQRSKKFRTGVDEFEPKLVGLKNEGQFIYDTKEEGKGNGGHLFGTELSIKDKLALLEYLKSR